MMLAGLLTLLLLGAQPGASAAPAHNVVLIVTDGLRPAELFTGASKALLGREGGVENEEGCAAKFWRETPEARRAALMPFIWGTVARDGQVFGNAALGSPARVANEQRVSYPGYNELFTGFADPRVDSNAFGQNPNVTVFEWLQTQPGFNRRVQAFATWETFFRIFNVGRSKLDLRAGWSPPFERERVRTPARDAIDAMHRATTPIFGGNALDSMTIVTLFESLRTQRPRVLFVGLGETDEWMHAGRYDLALEAAHRADGHIAALWALMQSMPEYRGNTTFLITTDHGRGGDEDGAWKDHGHEVQGSEDTWVAALGPGVPALGERSQAGTVTQSQVASTVAALLGRDWQKQQPNAASPLPLDAPARPGLAAAR